VLFRVLELTGETATREEEAVGAGVSVVSGQMVVVTSQELMTVETAVELL
jgi:hypothetical protein